MHQFRDKSLAQRELVSAGLLFYPVLQAADVLAYRADEVPVGEDQREHLELMREIARRFNARFGGEEEILVVPEHRIPQVGARIMDLQDPTKKMSTTGGSEEGTVYVLDEPQVIEKKLRRAVTDSADPPEIRRGDDKPGVTNLIDLLAVCSGRTPDQVVASMASARGYGDLKAAAAEAVIAELAPIRERYAELRPDEAALEATLARGAERAREIAAATLADVRAAMAVGPAPAASPCARAARMTRAAALRRERLAAGCAAGAHRPDRRDRARRHAALRGAGTAAAGARGRASAPSIASSLGRRPLERRLGARLDRAQLTALGERLPGEVGHRQRAAGRAAVDRQDHARARVERQQARRAPAGRGDAAGLRDEPTLGELGQARADRRARQAGLVHQLGAGDGLAVADEFENLAGDHGLGNLEASACGLRCHRVETHARPTRHPSGWARYTGRWGSGAVRNARSRSAVVSRSRGWIVSKAVWV